MGRWGGVKRGVVSEFEEDFVSNRGVGVGNRQIHVYDSVPLNGIKLFVMGIARVTQVSRLFRGFLLVMVKICR